MTSPVEKNRFDWVKKQGLQWLSKERLAKTSGRIRLAGLHSPVEVIRDRWGVPHIFAQNEPDLFFAQGFTHAQDRFWQMEFQRRLVAGRLAEIFAELAVSADQWMRVLGMRRVVEQEAAQVNGAASEAIQAYCTGVNACLTTQKLPMEFALLRYQPEPWTAADSLSWAKMISWMLSGNWDSELLRGQLIEKLGEERAAQMELRAEDRWPLILDLPDLLNFRGHLAMLCREWTGPGPREGVGSNNWVVAGSRTTTGKPFLANDMHLLLNAPAIWYENHLSGGGLNVTGVSLPGLPLVIAGHNDHVAWGFTAGFTDVQDLYEEHLRLNAAGTVEYEYQGSWNAAETRREEIRVRGSASIFQEVIVTRHGPVISPLIEDEVSVPLALRWTAHETSGGTFNAVYAMNRAQSCAEFHAALRDWNSPALNAVYADCDGNIAYTLAGKVPIRAQGDGLVPAPGWSGTHEWTGYIPFEELPHLENPESGYIVTANNRVASAEYPYWLGCDFLSGDRAERIIELILNRPSIDREYMQDMQFDQVSPSAQTVANVVGKLAVEAELQPVVDLLGSWNGTVGANDPAAVVYQVLVQHLLQMILGRHLGDHAPRYSGKIAHEMSGGGIWGYHAREWLRALLAAPQSPWFDLGAGENRDDVLRQALRSTVAFLTEEQGPDMHAWAWGWYHQLTFRHTLGRQRPLDELFNRGPYPVGGDAHTIWSTTSMMDRLDSSEGIIGPPFRFIADLSDLNQSVGLLAPGQSGQPGSPHYDDQVRAWFQQGYHPMLYRRADILREQEAWLVLYP